MADIRKHKTGSMVAELQARAPIHVIALFVPCEDKDATHRGTDGKKMQLRVWAAVPPSDAVQSELLRAIAKAITNCGQKAAVKRG